MHLENCYCYCTYIYQPSSQKDFKEVLSILPTLQRVLQGRLSFKPELNPGSQGGKPHPHPLRHYCKQSSNLSKVSASKIISIKKALKLCLLTCAHRHHMVLWDKQLIVHVMWLFVEARSITQRVYCMPTTSTSQIKTLRFNYLALSSTVAQCPFHARTTKNNVQK